MHYVKRAIIMAAGTGSRMQPVTLQQTTASENGIEIKNLAPKFRKRLSDPYMVRYEYSAELENKPIHTTTHAGQEFDLVISGKLKVYLARSDAGAKLL